MENARPPTSWKDLFAAKSGSPTLALNFLSVKRLGHSLVIIKQGSPVGPALSLYAAQTPFARLAKSIWRLTLPLGVAPGLRRETVSVDRADPFLEFLRTISNTQTTPHFSVLAGNPTEPSRRFLLVPFDSAGQPVGQTERMFR